MWDAFAIILFFVGFGLRMNGDLSNGGIVYAIDLMLFIMRVFELFYVDKTLGPYVVMMGKMVSVFFYFYAWEPNKFIHVLLYRLIQYGFCYTLLHCRRYFVIPKNFLSFLGSLLLNGRKITGVLKRKWFRNSLKQPDMMSCIISYLMTEITFMS